MEIQISDLAISKIKESNHLKGRLMSAFDRGQDSILNWLKAKDYRLTTKGAVEIISQETGLREDEILVRKDSGTGG
jgi:hypothetical protein